MSGIHPIVKIIQGTWKITRSKIKRGQWMLKIMIFVPKHSSSKNTVMMQNAFVWLAFRQNAQLQNSQYFNTAWLINSSFPGNRFVSKRWINIVSLFILTLQLFLCIRGSEIFRWKFWHLFLYHKFKVLLRNFFFLFYKFCVCLQLNRTCNFRFSPVFRNRLLALKM